MVRIGNLGIAVGIGFLSNDIFLEKRYGGHDGRHFSEVIFAPFDWS
jgi:hypothetical protein